MSAVGLWLLASGLATLGATGASSVLDLVSPRRRTMRAARTMPTTKIADASSGDVVKIVGRVEAGVESLSAPLTGRPCACYVARLELLQRGAWRPIAEEQKSCGFLVEDETGRAEVLVGTPFVHLVVDRFWDPKELDAESSFDMERALFQLGMEPKTLTERSLRYRYGEGMLEGGETVTVVGQATWSHGAEPGLSYRDQSNRLQLTAPPGKSLFVSDGLHYV